MAVNVHPLSMQLLQLKYVCLRLIAPAQKMLTGKQTNKQKPKLQLSSAEAKMLLGMVYQLGKLVGECAKA